MATHWDSKSTRFTGRFSATTESLDNMKGTLGHVDFVAGRLTDAAKNYTKAINDVLVNFCTFGHGVPGAGRKDAVELDEELYSHMRKINEVFNADAEQTIQLAGGEVTNALHEVGTDPLFPSNKYETKDATHAARRILERPWRCDAKLCRIVDDIVTGPNSICQRLRNSAEFRDRLKAAIARMRPHVRNVEHMSHALHRFDSIIMPLVRIVLFFHAMIDVSEEIATLRHGQRSGKDSEAFLTILSGEDGLMTGLLIGMMCDAGFAALSLLRFFDTEQYDIARVSGEISNFAKEAAFLFVNENAATHPMTFTSAMLEALQYIDNDFKYNQIITNASKVETSVYSLGGIGAA